VAGPIWLDSLTEQGYLLAALLLLQKGKAKTSQEAEQSRIVAVMVPRFFETFDALSPTLC